MPAVCVSPVVQDLKSQLEHERDKRAEQVCLRKEPFQIFKEPCMILNEAY